MQRKFNIIIASRETTSSVPLLSSGLHWRVVDLSLAMLICVMRLRSSGSNVSFMACVNMELDVLRSTSGFICLTKGKHMWAFLLFFMGIPGTGGADLSQLGTLYQNGSRLLECW